MSDRRILNRHNFAYVDRYTVNQEAKKFHSLAHRLIKQASRKVDRLACSRILQLNNQGEQEKERTALKIIGGVIEVVDETLLRHLGSNGKQKLSQAKRKLKSIKKV